MTDGVGRAFEEVVRNTVFALFAILSVFRGHAYSWLRAHCRYPSGSPPRRGIGFSTGKRRATVRLSNKYWRMLLRSELRLE